ncbi:hypothetical protein SCOCK_20027 [Actinacidiphila cocklensis]|uniref:Uncharacterized protein n=1 Tax=Actinacidiphila cocklensis TaxID=887465 RepID=A0A9W4GRV3_9ACTN|nr:hypothetical protein SCOCK_20027 [Actinacidiphila cocklensis]
MLGAYPAHPDHNPGANGWRSTPSLALMYVSHRPSAFRDHPGRCIRCTSAIPCSSIGRAAGC